jgi:hypothetical protein
MPSGAVWPAPGRVRLEDVEKVLTDRTADFRLLMSRGDVAYSVIRGGPRVSQ